MKKLLPLVLVLILISGCSVENYSPEIPLTFQSTARVTSGDFSFSCEICKSESNVIVSILDTNAKGMTMKYDGGTLTFLYDSFEHKIDAENFEKSNIAIVIYEVFQYLDTAETINSAKTDNGFRYNGKISLGDFILLQNDDNSFSSLIIKSADYKVEFI